MKRLPTKDSSTVKINVRLAAGILRAALLEEQWPNHPEQDLALKMAWWWAKQRQFWNKMMQW
jgi:hypothetical protein